MKINLQLRYIFLIILLVLLAIYSLYQARVILTGPRISIDNPKNGEIVFTPLVTIEGTAKNIAWISLNDRQIFTDEEGKWNEKLIVSSGISIMTVKARDRSGREIERSVQIVLN